MVKLFISFSLNLLLISGFWRLDIISGVDNTVHNEIERLSGPQFADLRLEVVLLSLTKETGRESKNWYGSYIGINFMVIEWNGDFAKRNFVGQLVGAELSRDETGRVSLSVRQRFLLRDVSCRWKTIRFI
jgi:hypothetical protein